MADTPRTLADLLALLVDNTSGDISEQDVRDLLVSLFALTTKGDVLGINGAGIITRLGVGGDTEVLTADSGETTGLKWAAAGGHAEAHGTAEHTEGTAWRVTYQDASGDDVELILGADGTFLQSNGASAAPTFGALVQSDVPGHGAAEHTEHGNWKVVYTDASGDETELALGADGTFLQANGVASAPTFAALVQTDIAGHGIAQHTEHANWKVVYTDGSGDEQELALGADGTFLQSGGASTLPEFTALADGDIPATHSGSTHHDEAHVHDAGVVTYTPAVAADWDSDADPGDTDDALDQLAERIDDTEALEHAQAHTLASHSTKAHSELSDAPTSAHHVTSRPYTYSITFGWDPQSPQVFAP